jgi:prepilin-type N-terminal cleavage/methylation domain-containing protein
MIRKLVNAEGGFTLVESVLAVVILGIALGACILSFSMAMRAVSTAGNQQVALHSARLELEGLRTYSLTNSTSPLTSGTHSFATNGVTGTFVVSVVDAWTKNVTVNVPYLNHIHGGTSTNTLVTSLVSTLHP